MARFKVIKTGAEFSEKIYALGENAKPVAESALKGGAAVVANEVRRGIAGLPANTGITRKGLEDSLGIAWVR